MESKNESNANILKAKIQDLLEHKKDKSLADLSLEKLIEEVNIYHQELVYQNEELIRTRNELELSEKNYIDIFNNAPIGYLILNESGIIEKVNKSFLNILNLNKYETKNKAFNNFVEHDSQDTFYFHLKDLKKSFEKQTCNLFLSKNEKSNNSILISESEVENDTKKVHVNLQSNIYYIEGEKIYIQISITDITERERIEDEIKQLNQHLEEKVKERTAQLEASNEDLEAFAYSVSHDLRAPLRHIDGFTRLLKTSLKESSEEIEIYLKKITESAIKMSQMIDDLLKFSRLGRKLLLKNKIDLNILVNQVIESFRIDNVDRKVEFRVGTLPIIEGDYGLIQIVFENLISNALKFTSKKDLAIIDLDQDNSNNKGYNIYIKDNGVGFDMAYADKLFGVFQRLHHENEFSGTGIGLANIKQIIQKHGGTIRAEGEIDKGATFYLSL